MPQEALQVEVEPAVSGGHTTSPYFRDADPDFPSPTQPNTSPATRRSIHFAAGTTSKKAARARGGQQPDAPQPSYEYSPARATYTSTFKGYAIEGMSGDQKLIRQRWLCDWIKEIKEQKTLPPFTLRNIGLDEAPQDVTDDQVDQVLAVLPDHEVKRFEVMYSRTMGVQLAMAGAMDTDFIENHIGNALTRFRDHRRQYVQMSYDREAKEKTDLLAAKPWEFAVNAFNRRVEAAVLIQRRFRMWRSQCRTQGWWPSDENPEHWKHWTEFRAKYGWDDVELVDAYGDTVERTDGGKKTKWKRGKMPPHVQARYLEQIGHVREHSGNPSFAAGMLDKDAADALRSYERSQRLAEILATRWIRLQEREARRAQWRAEADARRAAGEEVGSEDGVESDTDEDEDDKLCSPAERERRRQARYLAFISDPEVRRLVQEGVAQFVPSGIQLGTNVISGGRPLSSANMRNLDADLGSGLSRSNSHHMAALLNSFQVAHRYKLKLMEARRAGEGVLPRPPMDLGADVLRLYGDIMSGVIETYQLDLEKALREGRTPPPPPAGISKQSLMMYNDVIANLRRMETGYDTDDAEDDAPRVRRLTKYGQAWVRAMDKSTTTRRRLLRTRSQGALGTQNAALYRPANAPKPRYEVPTGATASASDGEASDGEDDTAAAAEPATTGTTAGATGTTAGGVGSVSIKKRAKPKRVFSFRDLSVGHATTLQPLTASVAFKLHGSVASNEKRRTRPLVVLDTQDMAGVDWQPTSNVPEGVEVSSPIARIPDWQPEAAYVPLASPSQKQPPKTFRSIRSRALDTLASSKQGLASAAASVLRNLISAEGDGTPTGAGGDVTPTEYDEPQHHDLNRRSDMNIAGLNTPYMPTLEEDDLDWAGVERGMSESEFGVPGPVAAGVPLSTLQSGNSFRQLIRAGTLAREAAAAGGGTIAAAAHALAAYGAPPPPPAQDPRSLANFFVALPASIQVPTTLRPQFHLGPESSEPVSTFSKFPSFAKASAPGQMGPRTIAPNAPGQLDYENSEASMGRRVFSNSISGYYPALPHAPGMPGATAQARQRAVSVLGVPPQRSPLAQGTTNAYPLTPEPSAVSDAFALGLHTGPNNPNRSLALAQLAVSLMRPSAPSAGAILPAGIARLSAPGPPPGADPSAPQMSAYSSRFGARLTDALQAPQQGGNLRSKSQGGAAAGGEDSDGGGSAGGGPSGSPSRGGRSRAGLSEGGDSSPGGLGNPRSNLALDALTSLVNGPKQQKVRQTMAELMGKSNGQAALLWRKARDAVSRLLASYPAEVGDMMREAGLADLAPTQLLDRAMTILRAPRRMQLEDCGEVVQVRGRPHSAGTTRDVDRLAAIAVSHQGAAHTTSSSSNNPVARILGRPTGPSSKVANGHRMADFASGGLARVGPCPEMKALPEDGQEDEDLERAAERAAARQANPEMGWGEVSRTWSMGGLTRANSSARRREGGSQPGTRGGSRAETPRQSMTGGLGDMRGAVGRTSRSGREALGSGLAAEDSAPAGSGSPTTPPMRPRSRSYGGRGSMLVRDSADAAVSAAVSAGGAGAEGMAAEPALGRESWPALRPASREVGASDSPTRALTPQRSAVGAFSRSASVRVSAAISRVASSRTVGGRSMRSRGGVSRKGGNGDDVEKEQSEEEMMGPSAATGPFSFLGSVLADVFLEEHRLAKVEEKAAESLNPMFEGARGRWLQAQQAVEAQVAQQKAEHERLLLEHYRQMHGGHAAGGNLFNVGRMAIQQVTPEQRKAMQQRYTQLFRSEEYRWLHQHLRMGVVPDRLGESASGVPPEGIQGESSASGQQGLGSDPKSPDASPTAHLTRATQARMARVSAARDALKSGAGTAAATPLAGTPRGLSEAGTALGAAAGAGAVTGAAVTGAGAGAGAGAATVPSDVIKEDEEEEEKATGSQSAAGADGAAGEKGTFAGFGDASAKSRAGSAGARSRPSSAGAVCSTRPQTEGGGDGAGLLSDSDGTSYSRVGTPHSDAPAAPDGAATAADPQQQQQQRGMQGPGLQRDGGGGAGAEGRAASQYMAGKRELEAQRRRQGLYTPQGVAGVPAFTVAPQEWGWGGQGAQEEADAPAWLARLVTRMNVANKMGFTASGAQRQRFQQAAAFHQRAMGPPADMHNAVTVIKPSSPGPYDPNNPLLGTLPNAHTRPVGGCMVTRVDRNGVCSSCVTTLGGVVSAPPRPYSDLSPPRHASPAHTQEVITPFGPRSIAPVGPAPAPAPLKYCGVTSRPLSNSLALTGGLNLNGVMAAARARSPGGMTSRQGMRVNYHDSVRLSAPAGLYHDISPRGNGSTDRLPTVNAISMPPTRVGRPTATPPGEGLLLSTTPNMVKVRRSVHAMTPALGGMV